MEVNYSTIDVYRGLKPYGQYRTDESALSVLRNCIDNVLSKPAPNDDKIYCNRTYDGLLCWDDTEAGDTAYLPCPEFVQGYNPLSSAKKECGQDGVWYSHPRSGRPWTDYSPCLDRSVETFDTLYMAGYMTSLCFTFVAFVIFQTFRQLKCARVTIHKNLFVSYFLTCLCWILFLRLVVSDMDVVRENTIWCQLLHILTQYLVFSNYAWMFMEGFFLHNILVWTFVSGEKLLKICLVSGWGGSAVPILVYAIVRGLSEEGTKHCWIAESKLNWILGVPVAVLLIINLVFLINIIRILFSKLRATNREDNSLRRTARATLILIPLLGLQYILIPFKPKKGSDAERPYLIFTAVLISFQGALVALLFCFFNGEVLTLLKRRIMSHLPNRGANSGQRRNVSGRTTADTFYFSSTKNDCSPNNISAASGASFCLLNSGTTENHTQENVES